MQRNCPVMSEGVQLMREVLEVASRYEIMNFNLAQLVDTSFLARPVDSGYARSHSRSWLPQVDGFPLPEDVFLSQVSKTYVTFGDLVHKAYMYYWALAKGFKRALLEMNYLSLKCASAIVVESRGALIWHLQSLIQHIMRLDDEITGVKSVMPIGMVKALDTACKLISSVIRGPVNFYIGAELDKLKGMRQQYEQEKQTMMSSYLGQPHSYYPGGVVLL